MNILVHQCDFAWHNRSNFKTFHLFYLVSKKYSRPNNDSQEPTYEQPRLIHLIPQRGMDHAVDYEAFLEMLGNHQWWKETDSQTTDTEWDRAALQNPKLCELLKEEGYTKEGNCIPQGKYICQHAKLTDKSVVDLTTNIESDVIAVKKLPSLQKSDFSQLQELEKQCGDAPRSRLV